MKPGRELDVLVAEKVFGAKVTHLNQQAGWRIDYVADKEECNRPILTDYGIDGYQLKRYSMSIVAAWDILHYLDSQVEAFSVTISQAYDGPWHCWIKFAGSKVTDGIEHNGASAPHAICLAALRAVGAIQ